MAIRAIHSGSSSPLIPKFPLGNNITRGGKHGLCGATHLPASRTFEDIRGQRKALRKTGSGRAVQYLARPQVY